MTSVRSLKFREAAALPPARLVREVPLPLAAGPTALIGWYEGLVDGRTDHVSLDFNGSASRREAGEAPLVRVHYECVTGDVFGSLRCDCGPQMTEAIERCAAERGLILYIRQEGRGIGLAAKIDAYHLQDLGLDTYAANRELGLPADARDHRVAAQMLLARGIGRVRLLTNNPDKRAALERAGIAVAEMVPTRVYDNPHNHHYLETKREIGGHALGGPSGGEGAIPPARS